MTAGKAKRITGGSLLAAGKAERTAGGSLCPLERRRGPLVSRFLTAGQAKRAAGGPLFGRREGEEDRWWTAFFGKPALSSRRLQIQVDSSRRGSLRRFLREEGSPGRFLREECRWFSWFAVLFAKRQFPTDGTPPSGQNPLIRALFAKTALSSRRSGSQCKDRFGSSNHL